MNANTLCCGGPVNEIELLDIRCKLDDPAQLTDDSQILIHRRSAQLTHSCQLTDVEIPIDVLRVVPQEDRWDVCLRYPRPANLSPFGLGVLHATPYSRPDDA